MACCLFVADLGSKYFGLESEPELSDLMNEVASKVPAKWKQISIQLGLTPEDQKHFMELTSGDPLQCFTSVFRVWKSRATRPYTDWKSRATRPYTDWKSRATRPYTWSTVIEALESPAVNEMRLAQELRKKLQSEWDSGEQSKLQFSLGVDVLPLGVMLASFLASYIPSLQILR